MIWYATPRVFRVFVFTLSTLRVAYQNGEWNLILFFLSTWRSAPHSLGGIYNLLFSFSIYCDIITSPVRAVRSDFVWLVIKKRAASYLRVQTHFSGRSAISTRPPRHCDTRTRRHSSWPCSQCVCVSRCGGVWWLGVELNSIKLFGKSDLCWCELGYKAAISPCYWRTGSPLSFGGQ